MKIFKSKKYKYFTKKLEGVKYAILDLEFKRFKTLEIKEDIRKEYDNCKAQIQLHTEKYKAEQKIGKLNKDEMARIDDSKVKAEAERDRLLEQIKGLEREVSGAKPSNEEPNGYDGIEQTIDSLRELQEMLFDYMKKL